jgi:hypothetical protein
MSQEDPLTIGAVARRFGCPAGQSERFCELGLLPAGPHVDAYRMFLSIRLGWPPFNFGCCGRDMPRHFSSDAPITGGRGVEDFDLLASQGVATPCALLSIDPVDHHARSVSPDDAPLAPSSVQHTRPSILSWQARALSPRCGNLVGLATRRYAGWFTTGRFPPHRPRTARQLAPNHLLPVRFSHQADLRSSQPGWAEYASLISPNREGEKL